MTQCRKAENCDYHAYGYPVNWRQRNECIDKCVEEYNK